VDIWKAEKCLELLATWALVSGRGRTDNDANDEGYDAYWDGLDCEDNPYDGEKDADAHLSWEEGCRKAHEHDYDESDKYDYAASDEDLSSSGRIAAETKLIRSSPTTRRDGDASHALPDYRQPRTMALAVLA